MALAVFALVATAYAAKWVAVPGPRPPSCVHPIRMTFVPTITIALLVLATAGQDLLPTAARVAWWIGAVGPPGPDRRHTSAPGSAATTSG